MNKQQQTFPPKKPSIFERARENIAKLITDARHREKTAHELGIKLPASAARISASHNAPESIAGYNDFVAAVEAYEAAAGSPQLGRGAATSGQAPAVTAGTEIPPNDPIKSAFAEANEERDPLRRAILFSQASRLIVKPPNEKLTKEQIHALRLEAANEADPLMRARLHARASQALKNS